MIPADARGTLAGLFIHPIKSCAGIAVPNSLVVETGLEFDRAWMVVDDGGVMVTQRTLPRMALVRPTLRHDDLVLRAPGMLTLHVSLDTVEAATTARVWNDTVRAFDMGALAAQWFSDFLGRRLRLVRFDPDQKRLSPHAWTGGVDAENAFADAYPLLVCGSASLAELNRRLPAAVGIERFRPNLVVDGLDAFDEDHVATLVVDADGGPVRLALVKPCVRCAIPNVDPATGEAGAEPGATLAAFRADARMDGGITFGMNAIVEDGVERLLRVGASVAVTYAF